MTSDASDEEAAWRDLVAHYGTPADSDGGGGPWPARENLPESAAGATAPGPAGGEAAGPAAAGPADGESAGPAAAGPASAGHAAAGHASAGPASAGPASADSASAGPASAGPASAGPASADSASADPASADPASADPASADLGPAAAGPTDGESAGPTAAMGGQADRAGDAPGMTGPQPAGDAGPVPGVIPAPPQIRIVRPAVPIPLPATGDDDSGDDHYVPPDPPPLPRLDPVSKFAWAALFGGPGYLLLAVTLSWVIPGWAAFCAVAAFVGGFATLVVRLGDRGPRDSGPDDGAVV